MGLNIEKDKARIEKELSSLSAQQKSTEKRLSERQDRLVSIGKEKIELEERIVALRDARGAALAEGQPATDITTELRGVTDELDCLADAEAGLAKSITALESEMTTIQGKIDSLERERKDLALKMAGIAYNKAAASFAVALRDLDKAFHGIGFTEAVKFYHGTQGFMAQFPSVPLIPIAYIGGENEAPDTAIERAAYYHWNTSADSCFAKERGLPMAAERAA